MSDSAQPPYAPQPQPFGSAQPQPPMTPPGAVVPVTAVPVTPALPPQYSGQGAPPYPPAPAYGAAQVSETITFGYSDQLAPDEVQPRRKRRSGTILLAGVLVLLVGAGAIAGAWVWFGWGTTQPEEALPGSSVAFARVDLSPGLGQKLKINNLAQKFPTNGTSTDDLVGQAEKKIFDGLNVDGVSYEADIKPWFGERVGVAAWSPGGAKEPCVLIALASNDDGKATDTLTKVRNKLGSKEFGFTMYKSYAVLANCSSAGLDSQSGADQAVAAAKSESLAGRKTFTDAVAKLPSGEAVVAYVDLKALEAAMPGGFGNLAGVGMLGGSLGGVMPTTALSGQLVLGAKAVDDGVEVQYRLVGGTTSHSGHNVLSKLDALPANTAVGVVADFGAVAGASGPLDQQLQFLLGGDGGIPAAQRTAFDALLHSVLSVAVTSVGAGTPAVQVSATTPDESGASALESMINTLLPHLATGQAKPTLVRNGSTVSVTVGDFHAQGSLSDSALYKEATAGAPSNTISAAYVDLGALGGSIVTGNARGMVAPIKAIGLTAGYDGADTVGTLRVIIK